MTTTRPPQKDFYSIRSPNAPQQLENAVVSRKAAIKMGYKMYWNGGPCANGHISVRYTYTGKCKMCVQSYRSEEIAFQDIDTDYLNSDRNWKENVYVKSE